MLAVVIVRLVIVSQVLSLSDNIEPVEVVSLEKDLCSSSLEMGETGRATRCSSDSERSSGESEVKRRHVAIIGVKEMLKMQTNSWNLLLF